MGTLDLSGADTRGFAPLPSGRWPAVVHEAEMTETAGNPGAKLPAGLAMLKIQFRCTHEDYSSNRVFGNYVTEFPPDYDRDKVAKMQGNIVNMLIALGYDEKDVRGGKFKLDADDLVGRECDIIVGQQPDRNDPSEKVNNLRGVKPLGSGETSDGGGLL